MNMMAEDSARKPHVVVLPWTPQGHVNPLLAFAKCLSSKRLQVSVLITKNVADSANLSECSSITIASISDGSEEKKENENFKEFMDRIKTNVSRDLVKFLDESSNCARAIIYDATMPWVQDIAHERGLLAAPFFVGSCAATAVYYHLRKGSLKYPYEDSTVVLPALPAFEKKYLPNFMIDDPAPVNFMCNMLSNLERADYIFFNSFDSLEFRIIEWMRGLWPKIRTVGPTFLLEHNDSGGGNNHSINLFETKEDACSEWLDSRETGSVVYLSFGSIADPGKEQMEEIAHGLIMSNCYFLWVVRSSEVHKLPQDFSSEKGLIVGWCHQPQVLAHRALACFLTHCGWNSVVEALSYAVPLIAMPQFVDHNPQAKFVEDVWRVGVGVDAGENGIIGREEIAMRIKQVVGGHEGIELTRNACRWKELAAEAVQNGGTSLKNIDEFASQLIFADQEPQS